MLSVIGSPLHHHPVSPSPSSISSVSACHGILQPSNTWWGGLWRRRVRDAVTNSSRWTTGYGFIKLQARRHIMVDSQSDMAVDNGFMACSRQLNPRWREIFVSYWKNFWDSKRLSLVNIPNWSTLQPCYNAHFWSLAKERRNETNVITRYGFSTAQIALNVWCTCRSCRASMKHIR